MVKAKLVRRLKNGIKLDPCFFAVFAPVFATAFVVEMALKSLLASSTVNSIPVRVTFSTTAFRFFFVPVILSSSD